MAWLGWFRRGSSDTERLDRIARMGAEKARESAAKTLNEVRKIIGFRQY